MSFELGPADEKFLESEDFKSGKQSFSLSMIFWRICSKEYFASIVKGFNSMMDNGILAGYHIDSMKVRLYDGQTHAVDSKPLAFELCAKEGFKEASKNVVLFYLNLS